MQGLETLPVIWLDIAGSLSMSSYANHKQVLF